MGTPYMKPQYVQQQWAAGQMAGQMPGQMPAQVPAPPPSNIVRMSNLPPPAAWTAGGAIHTGGLNPSHPNAIAGLLERKQQAEMRAASGFAGGGRGGAPGNIGFLTYEKQMAVMAGKTQSSLHDDMANILSWEAKLQAAAKSASSGPAASKPIGEGLPLPLPPSPLILISPPPCSLSPPSLLCPPI